MPIIQNFSLHPYDFPLREEKVGDPARVSLPAGVNVGRGKVRPSETVVTDEQLALIQEHDIAGVWFGPDSLVVKPAVVESEGEKRDEGDDLVPAEKFRSEASSPTMPWGSGPRPDGWPSAATTAEPVADQAATVEEGVK